MSTAITSSNRTRSEWDRYTAKPTSVAAFMSERPHQPVDVDEIIARDAIVPNPFGHVIAIDECGAPVHVGTIGADITIARQEAS